MMWSNAFIHLLLEDSIIIHLFCCCTSFSWEPVVTELQLGSGEDKSCAATFRLSLDLLRACRGGEFFSAEFVLPFMVGRFGDL